MSVHWPRPPPGGGKQWPSARELDKIYESAGIRPYRSIVGDVRDTEYTRYIPAAPPFHDHKDYLVPQLRITPQSFAPARAHSNSDLREAQHFYRQSPEWQKRNRELALRAQAERRLAQIQERSRNVRLLAEAYGPYGPDVLDAREYKAAMEEQVRLLKKAEERRRWS
jgi:hypothetical protein